MAVFYCFYFHFNMFEDTTLNLVDVKVLKKDIRVYNGVGTHAEDPGLDPDWDHLIFCLLL